MMSLVHEPCHHGEHVAFAVSLCPNAIDDAETTCWMAPPMPRRLVVRGALAATVAGVRLAGVGPTMLAESRWNP